MNERELKIFALEIKGVTIAQFTVRPNLGTALKMALVTGVIAGGGYLHHLRHSEPFLPKSQAQQNDNVGVFIIDGRNEQTWKVNHQKVKNKNGLQTVNPSYNSRQVPKGYWLTESHGASE